MVGLTTKQKDELNTAIIEYLVHNKYFDTADNFKRESNAALPPPTTDQTKIDILEKKWTSLARLKKQVWDLEKQIK